MACRSQDVFFLFFFNKTSSVEFKTPKHFFFDFFYSDDVDFTQNFSSTSSKGDLTINYGIR